MSQEAGQVVKQEGGDNDLVERIRRSAYFTPIHNSLSRIFDPKAFIGRAPDQVSHIILNCMGYLSLSCILKLQLRVVKFAYLSHTLILMEKKKITYFFEEILAEHKSYI